ncbi:MAG: energy transducer TonB [Proteobacteria bacterium]|nr:energy transducer TonB [Pseudomonadota bacterium]
MNRKYLLLAIIISLLIHLFAFLSSLFFEGDLKRTGKKKEEIIEIVPYYPPRIIPPKLSDKELKALGARDTKTGEENRLPEISKSIPKVLEDIKQKEALKSETSPEKTQIKQEEPVKPQVKMQDSRTDDEKRIKDELKPKEEKELPNLKSLIPKSTDLLAKLPKEESISLDTGNIKGSKELVLNTREYKYWSYLEKVKRKVEAVWRYPEVARERGIGGRLKISFTIGRDGKIENKMLIQSSGYAFLDDAAMKALKDASPLAPFPKEWDVDKINIDGTFIYEINLIK